MRMNNQKESVKFRKTQQGLYDVENGVSSTGFDNDDNDKGGQDKNQKAFKNTVIVTVLVMIWYTTAIFAITSSKMIMIERRLPFLLCVIQFSTASIVTYFVKLFQLRKNKSNNKYNNNPTNKLKSTFNNNTAYSDQKPNHQIKTNFSIGKSYYSNTPSQLADMSSPLSLATFPHSSSKNRTYFSSLLNMSQFDIYVYQIAISYTLGFIFTNIAFSVAPPSFAETIKSAEPISSVGLAYFFFNEGTTLLTYLTLIPICLGVGISCIDNKAGSDISVIHPHDQLSTDIGSMDTASVVGMAVRTLLPVVAVTFNWYGFLTAAISNLCFSSRAVISKRLFALSSSSSSSSSSSNSGSSGSPSTPSSSSSSSSSSSISNGNTSYNTSNSHNNSHNTTNNNNNNSTSPHQIDEVQLFSSISRIGLLLLIPIALMMEGHDIFHLFSTSANSHSHNNSGSYSNGDGHIGLMSDNIISNNNFNNTNDIISNYNNHNNNNNNNNNNNVYLIDPSGVAGGVGGGSDTLNYSLIRLFLLNGLAYSTYNLVSFLVLSRTDLVTHAVLNVFRRVFIITFTSWYFQHPLSMLNSTGVMIAVMGVLLFAYSKQQRGGGLCSGGSGGSGSNNKNQFLMNLWRWRCSNGSNNKNRDNNE